MTGRKERLAKVVALIDEVIGTRSVSTQEALDILEEIADAVSCRIDGLKDDLEAQSEIET